MMPVKPRSTGQEARKTRRKQKEEALRQSEERYRNIIEHMEDGYFEVDLAGKFTFVNDAECRNLGYSREELIGMSNRQYTDGKNAKVLYCLFNEIYKTGQPVKAHDLELTKKDGTKSYNELSASLIRNAEGRPIGFRGIARDVTERKQMEEALRQSEERYRTVLEEMEEWYFEADPTGNILFFNGAFSRALGHFPKELTGLNFQTFLKQEETGRMSQAFYQVIETGRPIKNFSYELVRPDGNPIFAEISILPKRDKAGKVIGFRGVGHDITDRKEAEKQIQYLATHDALTDLPNRLMFSQMLNHAIKSARRFKRQFAVLFIDLDRFKNINDTLGHEAGDLLLKEVATRLNQVLREIDLVARMGGDEFVVLIQEVQKPTHVSRVAEKILTAIIRPMVLMGQECRITASVGVCLYPKDGQDEQLLMKNADIAMYLAKEEGKNNYQFYSRTIKSQSIERLTIETNLRRALERNEFSLHYQAKLDFKTGGITGVEALLRWQNPDLGVISPTKLIPVAEETGLIVPIGRWVLQTACFQNVTWQRQGLPTVCLAVNLTRRQLLDDNLLEDVKTALRDSGMAPDLLELEITEGMLMQIPERVVGILTAIKNLGVRLALDDFGTGYSSLTQIRRYPIDTIKVDRSFIHDLPEHVEDTAITERSSPWARN